MCGQKCKRCHRNKHEHWSKQTAQDKHGFVFELISGMRLQEYLALQWADIDFTAATAMIRRVLVLKKSGDWLFKEPKNPKSGRTIPLPADG
jgi:integrase